MIKKFLEKEKLNSSGYSSFLYKLGEDFNFIVRIIIELIKPAKIEFPAISSAKNFEDLQWLIGGIPRRRNITLVTPEETAYIFKTIRENKPRNLLEIGTCRGGSALIISAAKPKESKFISIDLADLCVEKVKKLLDKNTALVKADSRSFTPPFEIDFIFIDGDHSFEGVKADFEHYFPHLNKGADILFHDANGIKYVFKSPGVSAFIKTIENNKNLKFIGDAGSIRHFKKIKSNG